MDRPGADCRVSVIGEPGPDGGLQPTGQLSGGCRWRVQWPTDATEALAFQSEEPQRATASTGVREHHLRRASAAHHAREKVQGQRHGRRWRLLPDLATALAEELAQRFTKGLAQGLTQGLTQRLTQELTESHYGSGGA